jgi:hypothetical protein
MPNLEPERLASREEFIVFVESLRRDLATNSDDVANLTLDDFLEALCAWTHDSDQNGAPESWRLAAQLLRAGLSYE